MQHDVPATLRVLDIPAPIRHTERMRFSPDGQRPMAATIQSHGEAVNKSAHRGAVIGLSPQRLLALRTHAPARYFGGLINTRPRRPWAGA